MSGKLTVGFIGLGSQGAPIARRIVDGGYPLRLWARRPASLEPFAKTPAQIDHSPAALAAECDILALCVVNDDDVRQVLIEQGALATLKPGSIVLIHSTLLPETVIALDEAARARGVELLDAPVSGGPRGAEAGAMTVMVGGEAETLARARPVIETFATSIPHLGPVGSGQLMKLLNNNLAYANLTMGIYAMELAAALGMDTAVAAGVIKTSSGASGGFGILTDKTLFDKIRGPASNLGKDVHHLLEVAEHRGLGEADLLRVTTTTASRIARFAEGGAR